MARGFLDHWEARLASNLDGDVDTAVTYSIEAKDARLDRLRRRLRPRGGLSDDASTSRPDPAGPRLPPTPAAPSLMELLDIDQGQARGYWTSRCGGCRRRDGSRSGAEYDQMVNEMADLESILASPTGCVRWWAPSAARI